MIDDSDIFVGIITKRHQVYRVGKGIKGVFKRALSRQAHLWTAPPWVLQECGYALKAGKKPILLCEPEIEAFGLQGDLEYIPFRPENPAATLDKLTQMITGLIAESAGVHVETVVTAQPVEPQQEIAAKPQESQQPEMPLMAQRYFEMMKAAGARDLAGMDRVYRSGLQIIQGGETDTSAVFWECVYQAMCFRAGREEALESLRKLELKHPDHPEPPDWIATCLLQFEEFDEASKKLTHAAALAGNGENATLLLRSADALKQAKKYEDARDLVLQKLLHKNVVSSVRLEALRLLYEILKLLDEKHEAFAVAEYALRQNPGNDTLRFTLGLDYLNGAPNELAIRHFQSLVRSNPKESGAFHNLALAYSKCSLPIKSVVHYKSAIELGGTSAAANLAYKYLECGMAQEAKELLDKAFQVADHSQRVEEALADISKRQQDEERKLESTSDAAAPQRDFLTLMGNGLLSSMTPLVEGIWHFPSVELHITVADGLVRGKRRLEVEERGLGTLLLGLSSLKTGAGPEKRIEDYALRGSLRGRVCTFELTIESRSASRQLSAMGRSPIAKSGHIVFEQDGLSATVSEVVNNKFERPYRITKARPTS